MQRILISVGLGCLLGALGLLVYTTWIYQIYYSGFTIDPHLLGFVVPSFQDLFLTTLLQPRNILLFFGIGWMIAYLILFLVGKIKLKMQEINATHESS